ncbi:CMP-N-acetylneuraminate-beta-galactosamide-alpha-2,3-sialyltransferase 4-like isoform X3 [Brienomyrus brachyistius]|uniref:CMP-N-acetylneuraminate-beta-galactosamide- alpha-2,3-sialyltransferase 4-like isoform X3 n=1 Tax=Brienomyrus brachyistius TaxID=42636 RepID=UPI0020B358A9|nr:CMP-N-acetylneuraminate-beta-galactosamide-alpha-2,3-sialyltransferase 4-like isoform X3 [Brienomyrus brachyistius]
MLRAVMLFVATGTVSVTFLTAWGGTLLSVYLVVARALAACRSLTWWGVYLRQDGESKKVIGCSRQKEKKRKGGGMRRDAPKMLMRVKDSNRLDCRSCVVVGNGYGIKGTSLGDTINHYDVVIRINDAPVRGFEKDVGNKTTMRFFYPESASQNPSVDNEADTLMVVIPFKPMDLIWLRNILFDEKRSRKGFWKSPPLMWLANRSNLRILDPFFMRNTAAQLLQARFRSKTKDFSLRPTTGILAIYVALNYCDMVHIAGFGYPPIQNLTAPTHYFGKTVMKSMKNSGHDVSYEAKALKRLEDSGAIVYLHPH